MQLAHLAALAEATFIEPLEILFHLFQLKQRGDLAPLFDVLFFESFASEDDERFGHFQAVAAVEDHIQRGIVRPRRCCPIGGDAPHRDIARRRRT